MRQNELPHIIIPDCAPTLECEKSLFEDSRLKDWSGWVEPWYGMSRRVQDLWKNIDPIY